MIPHFAYAVFIQIQSLYYAIGQQIGESSDKADKEQLEEARKLLSDYCRERFGSDLITYRPYRDPGSENR